MGRYVCIRTQGTVFQSSYQEDYKRAATFFCIVILDVTHELIGEYVRDRFCSSSEHGKNITAVIRTQFLIPNTSC